MTICLVTDRHRLVAAGAPAAAAARCLMSQVRHAVAAGIDLIQVRERDLEGRALASLVRDIVAAARGTRTRIVVNDRLDVALACGADGVHLRGDSMPAAAVRRIAPPPFLIGRSVHRIDDLAAADGADYVIAGTVFTTTSKPHADRLLGIDGLRAIVEASTAPVLAIGGVSEDRVEAVAAAGAAGIAAIGLFMRAADPSPGGCRACAITDTVVHARATFERALPRA